MMGGDIDTDDLAKERLVLSEVHVGSSTQDEEAEVVSRYTFLTPSYHGNNNARDSSSDSEGEKSDDSSSSSSSSVTRHRKRARHCHAPSSQRRARPTHEVLTVVHRMATTLGLVGQQVWSAAFLLGDFVLTHEELFAGMQVLELGAGPGVAGLVAGRVAQKCFLTDYHHEVCLLVRTPHLFYCAQVLKLLARNVEANRHLFTAEQSPMKSDAVGATTAGISYDDGSGSHGGPGHCVAAVRELDWFTFSREEGPTDEAICDYPAGEGDQGCQDTHNEGDVVKMVGGERSSEGNRSNFRPFAWRKDELEGLSSRSTSHDGALVIIAADVIYDEGLTDAFFDVLKLLMPPPTLPQSKIREDIIADDCKCDGDSVPKGAGSGGLAAGTPTANSASTDFGVVGLSSCSGNNSTVEEQDSSSVKRHAVLYLAIEKRFNFSMTELSVAATGYNALLRNVLDVTAERDSRVTGAEEGCAQQRLKSQKVFEGKRLPLTFQQCFRYHRSNAMELWEIWRRSDLNNVDT